MHQGRILSIALVACLVCTLAFLLNIYLTGRSPQILTGLVPFVQVDEPVVSGPVPAVVYTPFERAVDIRNSDERDIMSL